MNNIPENIKFKLAEIKSLELTIRELKEGVKKICNHRYTNGESALGGQYCRICYERFEE